MLIIIHQSAIAKEVDYVVGDHIRRMISAGKQPSLVTTYDCDTTDATDATLDAIYDFINDRVADAEFIFIDCKPNKESCEELKKLLYRPMTFFQNLEEYKEYIKTI